MGVHLVPALIDLQRSIAQPRTYITLNLRLTRCRLEGQLSEFPLSCSGSSLMGSYFDPLLLKGLLQVFISGILVFLPYSTLIFLSPQKLQSQPMAQFCIMISEGSQYTISSTKLQTRGSYCILCSSGSTIGFMMQFFLFEGLLPTLISQRQTWLVTPPFLICFFRCQSRSEALKSEPHITQYTLFSTIVTSQRKLASSQLKLGLQSNRGGGQGQGAGFCWQYVIGGGWPITGIRWGGGPCTYIGWGGPQTGLEPQIGSLDLIAGQLLAMTTRWGGGC